VIQDFPERGIASDQDIPPVNRGLDHLAVGIVTKNDALAMGTVGGSLM
jgi:hypothetical protein